MQWKVLSILWRHRKALSAIILCTSCVVLFCLYFYLNQDKSTNIKIKHYNGQVEWVEGERVMRTDSWKKIIDRTADTPHGCKLPLLDPWDEEVKEYVSSFPEVVKTNY